MAAANPIIDRIVRLPSASAVRLCPDLYHLATVEKTGWKAYREDVQLASYDHIMRAYSHRTIDFAELRRQTLDHLTDTLPRRLAVLTIKGYRYVEGGDDHSNSSSNNNSSNNNNSTDSNTGSNSEQYARITDSLQGMRRILLGDLPLVPGMLDDIRCHEITFTTVEGFHEEAVESLCVDLSGAYGQGTIEETKDVVAFAERMLAIGIGLDELFEMEAARGIPEGVADGRGGVGVLPWW
jgi:hypothetical protein